MNRLWVLSGILVEEKRACSRALWTRVLSVWFLTIAALVGRPPCMLWVRMQSNFPIFAQDFPIGWGHGPDIRMFRRKFRPSTV
ncbi:MAG: hypothetical protein EBR49_02970 [Betaproteobacteria bacterium]|nr:hypothetical protein [Betaproteobacteria bacterium]